MKIFITGATGFVGGAILQKFHSSSVYLKILRRSPKENPLPESNLVEYIQGDILKPEQWQDKLNDVDIVINLVGIIREFPKRGITFQRLHVDATNNIIKAAQSQGIKRYLHMSANGSRQNAPTGYLKTKYNAEELIKASGLEYTIFRPSLIFGANDSMTNMLASNMRKLPIFPCFGKGDFKMQPVYVKDVAEMYYIAAMGNDTENKIMHLGGPEEMTWRELLNKISFALDKKIIFPTVPISFVKIAASLLSKFDFFPITPDQLTMLLEGNITPNNDITKHLKTPEYIDDVMKRYLGREQN